MVRTRFRDGSKRFILRSSSALFRIACVGCNFCLLCVVRLPKTAKEAFFGKMRVDHVFAPKKIDPFDSEDQCIFIFSMEYGGYVRLEGRSYKYSALRIT